MFIIIVLDKYYLKDIFGNIHVVIGNRHPISGYISYVKYIPTNKKSIWYKNGIYYQRMVKQYLPEEVHKSYIYKIPDPWSDSLIPFTPKSIINEIYNPIKKLHEIICKPQDILEEEVLDLAKWIRSQANIPWNCIGVTGSILPGIHNPLISDIDLVVYGSICGWKVIEALNYEDKVVKRFNSSRLLEWSNRLSKRYGISIRHVIALYRLWRRGILYTGREFSIAYSGDKPKSFCGDKWLTIGFGRIKAYVIPSLHSLDYPIESHIEKYNVIEQTVTRNVDISIALSYETFFMPALIEEGWRIIDGIIQYNPYQGIGRIVVGVKERLGYIIKD